MAADRPYVAVVGGSVADGRVDEAAEAVGRGLARRGAIVVCGGLGGVMEAACRGARDEGGTTLGILPGADRADANPYVDVAVPTGMGEARNALVVRAADALVAVAGEFGTLSEIALALRLDKPVVGVWTWELARAGRAVDAIVRVDDPDQAAERAVALARGAADLRRIGSGKGPDLAP
ncbi:MAG TPA: TIGR00725 family protein [Acidimicrobiales bacterium]|nr:TIGR00725 family protein [Acidimicrobiales bacterium]